MTSNQESSGLLEPAPSVSPPEKRPGLLSRMKFRMTVDKTAFFTLVRTGAIDSLKNDLEKGATVNAHGSEGQTALTLATLYGQEEVLSLLLDYKAKTELKNKNGETALFVAVAKENEDILKLLLLRGADPNGSNSKDGKSPLAQAILCGNVSLTGLLLSQGATPYVICVNGEPALVYAAENDHIEIARLLMDHGVPADQPGNTSRTALSKAVISGSVGMVKLLMEHGANPNRQDSWGVSPMIITMQNRNRELMEIFCQFGHVPRKPDWMSSGRSSAAYGFADVMTGMSLA
ncbi:uncharacterized protein N7483_011729 [Penicillium malachiteum]|uniref:uncharacterized protein n=1 Tax=Penicillium malachiteum TaxID=1324776 RepID=UPI00254666BE|nr:uncharacterized protein N7483_011729 [Penicillium malachiteum]KAJ5714548.1 hypothetical protein N7483_011729 [Penicillium malachiteum]